MRDLRSEQEIIANWQGHPNKPLVSICCITYNHEPYIEDALEGFLIQETDFPFEILIHDDASSDRTPDIIRQYEIKFPNLIKPIYRKKNQYSQGKKPSVFNFDRAQGDYIATCEGDDFWTYPNKLQIQLNFMHNNLNCAMCFHMAEILDYSEIGHKSRYTQNYEDIVFFDMNRLFYEGGSNAPTASMFFRRSCVECLPGWFFRAPVGDMPLKLILSTKGKIAFLKKVMCIRRLGTKGSWNLRTRSNRYHLNDYLIGMTEMLSNFNKYSNFHYSDDIVRQIIFYQLQQNRIGISPWNNILELYTEYFYTLPVFERVKLFVMNYLSLLIRFKNAFQCVS